MPSVTYNGQSFAIDGRRFWILGASIHYARLPVEAWRRAIAAARDAGFNTIDTACPWTLHEPRQDRFDFSGQADVRRFISLCAEMGMRVILRPGPYIGSGFDGGGLPAWLAEIPGLRVREANEHYLERMFTYMRKLLNELDGLQVTKTLPGSSQGGPIMLVQAEHAWLCANPEQATKYLREINRIIRECGFNIPIINANDLWQDVPGTIDTWRGSDNLLEHLRQFRTLQTNAPRLLSVFNAASTPVWGEASPKSLAPAARLQYNLAQCLAAGAQPVVSPFAGGLNFGFLGGRLPGGPDRFCTTAAAAGAPYGEAGARGERFAAIRRPLTFAKHFGHVFADLEPDLQSVVPMIPPPPGNQPERSAKATHSNGLTVVPLEGSQGRIVFIFTDGQQRSTELLLDNGVRMPVELNSQPVSWYVFDADLNGSGRLDYANLCPFAIVDRSIVVLYGPEGAEGYLSINGAPLSVRVPSGHRPQVIDHKGITVVVCSESQIDQTFTDDNAVYVGVAGFNMEGRPIPAGDARPWVVTRGATLRALPEDDAAAVPANSGSRTKHTKKSIRLSDWSAASAQQYADGKSPRYATLSGPATLTACGAPTGYGWYRVALSASSAKKRLCAMPESADRVHLYVDGAFDHIHGVGLGATSEPFDLKLSKGEHTLVALVDNLGRFADGNELMERKGLFGHVWEVKPLRAAKPKRIEGTPIDPFTLRGYIAGLTKGQLSERDQVQWQFQHAKKTPILIEVQGATCTGTFILNDEPIAYYAGQLGSATMRLLISRDTHESFKRGKNALRFSPDQEQPKARRMISDATTLYECVEALTEKGSWSFAKWEPPVAREFAEVSKTAAKQMRGVPCWWRATFDGPEHLDRPLWFDTRGLSKGQVFLNGRNLGRYFTSTVKGKAVGPQTRLLLPTSWLKAGQPNEVVVFDEHGWDPGRTRLVLSPAGDLDERAT